MPTFYNFRPGHTSAKSQISADQKHANLITNKWAMNPQSVDQPGLFNTWPRNLLASSILSPSLVSSAQLPSYHHQLALMLALMQTYDATPIAPCITSCSQEKKTECSSVNLKACFASNVHLEKTLEEKVG